MTDEPAVRCWAVRDTGLLAAPPRFRGLTGAVRHHRGSGAAWPQLVELVLDGDELRAAGVGRWPVSAVSAEVVAAGPPVTFVLHVPGAARLLAAPAGPATDRLLARLAARAASEGPG